MEARTRVYVTRRMLPEALELIAAEADLEVWPQEHPPSPQQLREKVSVVQGVLTNIMDRVDAGLLDAAPQLKVVSHLGVGVDNIDVAQATRRGILVGNTPGVLAGATADLAFALLMSAARRVGESERWLRAGNWNMAFHPMFWLGADVHQATLGIIGLGVRSAWRWPNGAVVSTCGSYTIPGPANPVWNGSMAWNTLTARTC